MRRVNLSINFGRFVSDFYSNLYSDLDEAIKFAKEISENKCFYCGTELISDEGEEIKKYTYDHFFPASEFHLFTAGNIVLACINCNSTKSNISPKDFMLMDKEKYMASFTQEEYKDKIRLLNITYKEAFPDFYNLLFLENKEKIAFFEKEIFPLFNSWTLGTLEKSHIKGKYSNVLEDIEQNKENSLSKKKQNSLKEILEWGEKNDLKILNCEDILEYQNFLNKYLMENNEGNIEALKDLFVYIFPDKECYKEYIVPREQKSHLPIITLRNFMLDKDLITNNIKDKTHLRKLHRIYEVDQSFDLLIKLLNETSYTSDQIENYYLRAKEKFKDKYQL